MLTIQRASAGSGKTYTLAKKYILNLIAYQNNKGEWILRNERQIEDALQHILAITFTNKATNEMKSRIVENLAQLSSAIEKNLTKEDIKAIPYLLEFKDFFNVDFNQIGEAASIALREILNNYSLFKISTIDSFFQEILRTFTFEANINDSYQLEIDSSYVTDAALESAIHEIDIHPSKMGNAALWLKILMKEEARNSKDWNPFNNRFSPRSIYARLRNALIQLEKEDFKSIKEDIDSYFSDEKKIKALPHLYYTLKDKALKERENQVQNLKLYLKNINGIIERKNLTIKELQSNFLKQLQKIEKIDKTTEKIEFQFNWFTKNRSVFKKNFLTPYHPLDIEASKMYDLLENWIPSDSYYMAWMVYGPLLPYLGLILEIRFFLSQLLETNNLIQISDTSYILKKIIGNDDTPFVFERLGTKIDHYLIDEFQDTSQMQWQILRPLLNEGLAHDKDSLIIGDPKQSIYRFRNADHRLITQVVPLTFVNHISAGDSKEENTNWRSHTQIVEFNNKFFKSLAEVITKISSENGGNTNFNDLYSNVVQHPHNQDGKGYVEIQFLQKPENDDLNEESEDKNDKITWFEKQSLNKVPALISSLIERGYRQKDICVLVNTNERGKQVINSIISYNDKLIDSEIPIDFISEESLLVSSSPAIDTIIGVINNLINPYQYIKKDENKVKDEIQYFNWNNIESDFNIFSKKHEDLSPVEKIMLFLKQEGKEDVRKALFGGTEIPTLSSLVDRIVKYFLNPEIRKSEALYISSFQDLITEYSSSYQDDPTLFMEWWKSRGSKISVATPEGTDAVQIMTIHKSKGLEFKCVILPFASDSFNNLKEEWRWVTPYYFEDLEFPPVLPVKTNSILKDSMHSECYNEFYDQVLTDKLNMYYVAFTRAKNELYILTKQPYKSGNSLGDFLSRILEFNPVKGNYIWTIGTPLSREEIKEEIDIEIQKKDNSIITHFFEDYYVNDIKPRLLSSAKAVLPSGELENN